MDDVTKKTFENYNKMFAEMHNQIAQLRQKCQSNETMIGILRERVNRLTNSYRANGADEDVW